jgi:AcrR family transcriptional regulator
MNKIALEPVPVALGDPRNSKKEAILNCAEREFSARGYSATSLRVIAAAADVNQALIIYHFRSKENLYLEVFMRRGLQLTESRLHLLDELIASGSGRPTVEALVRSFLSPAIEMLKSKDGRDFLRLQARLQSEPAEVTSKLRATVYDRATRAYIEAFKAAVPDIDASAMVWRMTMMIGAYLYVVSDPTRLAQLSDGSCDAGDHDEMLRQFSSFFTGGFRAPLDGSRQG